MLSQFPINHGLGHLPPAPDSQDSSSEIHAIMLGLYIVGLLVCREEVAEARRGEEFFAH